jgi:hypothetical protein
MKISNPRYQWMMGDYTQEYNALKEKKSTKFPLENLKKLLLTIFICFAHANHCTVHNRNQINNSQKQLFICTRIVFQ